MLKSILKITGAQELSRNECKQIQGGFPNLCAGTGTGGVTSVGHSQACLANGAGDCWINGYLAACTGVGDRFWFY